MTSCSHYDWVRCFGNLSILIIALVNTILLVCMFRWHLKEKDPCKKKTWFKWKTWIYITLLYKQFSVTVRYTFSELWSGLYISLVVGENICMSESFLLICYYLAKKGLKFD